ncbi:MAG TPA: GNAT family protein [Candidatus Baltobacteraceae bacterium]|nr:GNAT family protein [Candidatus Baltobacteraceae bacterium]
MIDCGGVCVLRGWREGDVPALALLADDWDVARNLRDAFPFPYTLEDARDWIGRNARAGEPVNFAIEVEGELAGGIGVILGDAERRGTGEIGYWLGKRFWGRGIATAAAGAFSEYVFGRYDLRRVEAHAYGSNAASQRVLEKCGFKREGVLRGAVVKGSEVRDVHLFGRLRGE